MSHIALKNSGTIVTNLCIVIQIRIKLKLSICALICTLNLDKILDWLTETNLAFLNVVILAYYFIIIIMNSFFILPWIILGSTLVNGHLRK